MTDANQHMNQNVMEQGGFDLDRIRNTWAIESIRDLVQFSVPHSDSKDHKYFRSMGAKSAERPVIIERNRKMNEEMYFYHRQTYALGTFEEATTDSRSYTHDNIYVRYCRDYQLGKPISLEDAEKRYLEMMTNALAPVASKKKKLVVPTPTWSFGYGGATVALDDLYNIPSTLTTSN